MTAPATATIRNAAKAVILHDGQILLQRARWENQECYFLPGGSQHPDEPLDATVRREVHEETGLNVTVERLLWLREYIGAHHGTAPEEHRVEAIFLCQPDGTHHTLGGHAEDDTQTGLEWVNLAQVSTINAMPHALRAPIAALAHGAPPTRYLGDIT